MTGERKCQLSMPTLKEIKPYGKGRFQSVLEDDDYDEDQVIHSAAKKLVMKTSLDSMPVNFFDLPQR